jgi:hypothetical protein
MLKPKNIVRPVKLGRMDCCGVYAATFPNGRIAVYLTDGLDARVSINVPGVELNDDETLVKMTNACGPIREELLAMGVFTDTGSRYQVGFDSLELWRVDRNKIFRCFHRKLR